MTTAATRRIEPALLVILAGVVAALHIGKLPPAIPVLREALGLTLVQAGFLLSLVQLAGMTVGVVFGIVADGLGSRRSMGLGLALLSGASALGGFTHDVAPLMLLRAVEGFGFLLVVLPAPGLVRSLVEPRRASAMMGLWVPTCRLPRLWRCGRPLAITAIGWRGWWWALAVLSAAMALSSGTWCRERRFCRGRGTVLLAPAAAPDPGRAGPLAGGRLVRDVLRSVAGGDRLPAVAHVQSGVAGSAVGVLTAAVAAVNMVGNIGSGRRLQRGVAPGACCGSASRRWRCPPSQFAAAAIPLVAGAAICGGAAVLERRRADPATLFALAVRLRRAKARCRQPSAGCSNGRRSASRRAAARRRGGSTRGDWQCTWAVTAPARSSDSCSRSR